MAYIKCPTCDQPNPSDADTCSNCGAPLHEAIQPGEFPTKKVTSELEPILPQWLQDARQKSRQTTEDNIRDDSQDTKPRAPGPDDLLAGLEAQSEDDEEEVPDWLAGITGAKSKKKPEPKFTGSRRVELSGFSDFASEEQPASKEPEKGKQSSDLEDWFKQATSKPPEPKIELPAQEAPRAEPSGDISLDWMKNLGAQEPAPPAEAPASTASEDMSLDWMKNLGAQEPAAPAEVPASQTSEAEMPSWLQPEPKQERASTEDLGMPDWLKNLEGQPEKEEVAQPAAPAAEEPISLDWTEQLQAEPLAQEPEPPVAAGAEGDLPDWLKGLTEAAPPFKQPESEEFSPEKSFSTDWLTRPVPESTEEGGPTGIAGDDAVTLDWLKSMKSAPEEPAAEPREEPGMPDWFKQTGAEPAEGAPAESQPLAEVELPDWIKQPGGEEAMPPAAPKSEVPDWLGTAGSQPAEPEKPESIGVSPLDIDLPDWLKDTQEEKAAPAKEEAEVPDWLGGMASLPAEQPPAPVQQTAPLEEVPSLPPLPGAKQEPQTEQPSMLETPPMPFTTPEPLTLGSLDSLLTDVPDWLSEAGAPAPQETPEFPPAAEEAEVITPGALPSWVQAMRPVEAGSPGPSATSNEVLETKGGLAGLQGVLPSTPYPGPSSKPKAQSLKLQASDEQQSQADLLEQIMLAETRPEPMKVLARVTSQRYLRMGIGLVLFFVLAVSLLAGSQAFPLPAGIPTETQSAKEAVEAIPPGAPVLVVFDYEPSLVGEMEAAAAPLLSELITQKQPRMTILAATPTGSALAERLFSGPLGGLPKDYLNIGYLPGGLGGVRGFVQNPTLAMPLAANRTLAWSATQTQGIRSLADYAAIILIVDRADAGRTWIEQAKGLYGNSAFITISSAQAGPMLQPYYDSGQLSGLVAGIYDAAVLENASGGSGLARRYWDGYSLALLLAIVFIVGGGLWNLIVGIRERRSTEVG